MAYYFGSKHAPGHVPVRVSVYHIGNEEDDLIAAPDFDKLFVPGEKVKSMDYPETEFRNEMRLYFQVIAGTSYGFLLFRASGCQLQSVVTSEETQIGMIIMTYGTS